MLEVVPGCGWRDGRDGHATCYAWAAPCRQYGHQGKAVNLHMNPQAAINEVNGEGGRFMDLYRALNARLFREYEAEIIKRDGGSKKLLSGEFGKRGNYREPRRWQLRSLRRRVSRGYCHCDSLSGCWSCSRWHLAQLLGENWNWSTLPPRNGSQRGNWAPERNLGSNRLCLRLQAHLHTHKSRVSITMVKLRQRQPCRRGPARGSSARAPAMDEHHHCCCCYCHRRAKATPLPISQFLEVGSANEDKSELPSFGSVVFTLPSAESNPGLSAHISVMFTRTLEGNGKTTPQNSQKKQAEGKGKEIVQGEQEAGEQSSALEPPASEAGQHESFPPVGPAPSDIDEETWRKMWEGRPEGDGWAYIVEDNSLAEEADAFFAPLLSSSTHLKD